MASETLPELKAAAARFVQDIGSYANSDDSQPALDRVLASSGASAVAAAQIREVARSLLTPGSAVANVVYPQIGGLVPLSARATYASVMVVFRQDRLTPEGLLTGETRIADVRLRRDKQQWRIEGLESLGGDPVVRPPEVSDAARRLLDHPNVDLPDPARWDIHAGRVDPRVIDLLDRLAEQVSFRVTVIRSGHPVSVIDGRSKPPISGHNLGRAVDIWSLGGEPISAQRTRPDAPAIAIVRRLLAERVTRQLGLPRGWDLDGPGAAVFTNEVHDDHMHLSF